MSLLRYRAEESRNIAKAQAQAVQTARLDVSIARKRTQADIDGLVIPRKYAASIGNATDTVYLVTHSLGTTDVFVQVAAQGVDPVGSSIEILDVNSVRLTFPVAPGAGAYRIIVLG